MHREMNIRGSVDLSFSSESILSATPDSFLKKCTSSTGLSAPATFHQIGSVKMEDNQAMTPMTLVVFATPDLRCPNYKTFHARTF
jgi:hypothetical protein